MGCPYAFSKTGIKVYAVILILGTLPEFGKSASELSYDQEIAIVELVTYLICFVVDICLLLGVHWGKRGMFLPYLILHCIFIVILGIFGIIECVYLLPIQFPIYLFLMCAVDVAVEVLLWIGVYGHYDRLGNERIDSINNQIMKV